MRQVDAFVDAISRRTDYNLYTQAIAMRQAANAEGRDFKKFLEGLVEDGG
jgi:hypothetical protein